MNLGSVWPTSAASAVAILIKGGRHRTGESRPRERSERFGSDLHCVASSARDRCATPPLRSGAPSPHLAVHGLSHGPDM